MCVYSMVLDHYSKLIPDYIVPLPFTSTITTDTFTLGNFQIISQTEIDALKKLIAEFKEALEAAKTVDRLTNQPDCEDPEKKKLEDRVTILEQKIAVLIRDKINTV